VKNAVILILILAVLILGFLLIKDSDNTASGTQELGDSASDETVDDKLIRPPSFTEIEELTQAEWPDFYTSLPKCNEGEQICPFISINVIDSERSRENGFFTISLDVRGFADDSYEGYRRETMVKWDKDSQEFIIFPIGINDYTLCRYNLAKPGRNQTCS